ncbi:MAG: 2-isopropylmalate synthase [Candidatus Thermoplasmatota archaeon]|nr:2-isopropylmalate synthase [Candidatus Thermoplasmatota archaeon]
MDFVNGSGDYILSAGYVESSLRTGKYYSWGIDKTNVPERITVLDTTLRDGEQSPGVSISPVEKMKIAQMLEEAGVDVIEAGFPAASETEGIAVSQINSVSRKSQICALARCVPGDIEAAVNTGVKRIHLFIATSEIHMKHKLRMTEAQVLEAVERSVSSVAERGIKVEFSCEDATRSDLNFLNEVFLATKRNGATIGNIPDTVGAVSPPAMMEIVKTVRNATKSDISVHCHNDFGLATANTLFGVMGGASQVHVTVNGIGERAGNAAMEEVVMGIQTFLGARTGMRTEKLTELSEYVSEITGMRVQPNKAIVGENAFSHEAGIHVHGLINDVSTYEPIDPSLVGTGRKIILGKHSGLGSIQWIMKRNNIFADNSVAKEILRRVKELSESGTKVDESMVVNMFAKSYPSRIN